MIDAHLHLCNESVFPESKRVLKEARQSGVKLFVSCTASLDDFLRQDVVLAENSDIYAFYGVHPWYVEDAVGEWRDKVQESLKKQSVVGVGETGLDALKPDFLLQKKVFNEQMNLAATEDKVMALHNVKADVELIEMLRKVKNLPNFMLHSFAGAPENIKAFAGMGAYFSFSARIMRSKKEYVQQIISKIPTDRILVESDFDNSNREFDLINIYRFLADILKADYKEFECTVFNNVKRFLGL